MEDKQKHIKLRRNNLDKYLSDGGVHLDHFGNVAAYGNAQRPYINSFAKEISTEHNKEIASSPSKSPTRILVQKLMKEVQQAKKSSSDIASHKKPKPRGLER